MEFDEKELQELKEKKISIEDLNDHYFIKFIGNAKVENIENILKLLNENICSFQEIVDKFKSMKNNVNNPCLYRLLWNKELFENNKLNEDDLRYLLTRIDRSVELAELCENTILLKHIVANELFKELVNTFKDTKDARNNPCLYKLLENKKFSKELFENNRLNKEDLRYLLNAVDDWYELRELCDNTPLIKYVLNEFILDIETVKRFSPILENCDNSWSKENNIHTVFDLIEYDNKDNEEILKLNELNKKVCLLTNFDLTEYQRLELIEILRNNKIAQNTLIQIIDNHLQDQYDFENLKNLLNKEDRKSLKTKFNF